jgi:hypothetical protein
MTTASRAQGSAPTNALSFAGHQGEVVDHDVDRQVLPMTIAISPS